MNFREVVVSTRVGLGWLCVGCRGQSPPNLLAVSLHFLGVESLGEGKVLDSNRTGRWLITPLSFPCCNQVLVHPHQQVDWVGSPSHDKVSAIKKTLKGIRGDTVGCYRRGPGRTVGCWGWSWGTEGPPPPLLRAPQAWGRTLT